MSTLLTYLQIYWCSLYDVKYKCGDCMNFGVVSHKFSIVGIHTSGRYTQKVTKLYCYQPIVTATLTIQTEGLKGT
jgi:hypothetical protein